MNSLNSTISSHQKGQHLALTDWVTIQIMHEQSQSLRQIARALNCSPTTVKYELERGQISLYHGKRYRYDAQEAQRRYQIRRLKRKTKAKEQFPTAESLDNFVGQLVLSYNQSAAARRIARGFSGILDTIESYFD